MNKKRSEMNKKKEKKCKQRLNLNLRWMEKQLKIFIIRFCYCARALLILCCNVIVGVCCRMCAVFHSKQRITIWRRRSSKKKTVRFIFNIIIRMCWVVCFTTFNHATHADKTWPCMFGSVTRNDPHKKNHKHMCTPHNSLLVAHQIIFKTYNE